MLDNLSTGKRENLAPWQDQIELIEGDIRDAETVRWAMAGVDYYVVSGRPVLNVAGPFTSN